MSFITWPVGDISICKYTHMRSTTRIYRPKQNKHTYSSKKYKPTHIVQKYLLLMLRSLGFFKDFTLDMGSFATWLRTQKVHNNSFKNTEIYMVWGGWWWWMRRWITQVYTVFHFIILTLTTFVMLRANLFSARQKIGFKYGASTLRGAEMLKTLSYIYIRWVCFYNTGL